MRRMSLGCSLLAGALAAGVGLTPAAHAGQSLAHRCQRVEHYPYRKYECAGTAIEYGNLYCSASWADVGSDGSWTDGEARVYQISCSGLWTYSCYDVDYFSYVCEGEGFSPSTNDVCSVTWKDDDPDPLYSSGDVVKNSC